MAARNHRMAARVNEAQAQRCWIAEVTCHEQERRAQLRQQYRRMIARLARVLVPDHRTLCDAVQLPARRDDDGVLQTANAVAERAKAHAARLVAQGSAPAFVNGLLAAAGQLRPALASQEGARPGAQHVDHCIASTTNCRTTPT